MSDLSEIQKDYDCWHWSMAQTETNVQEPIYPWHATALKLLPNLNGKKLLEVGCGRGDFAIFLGRRFPEASIIATDFSPAAIQAAHKKLQPGNVRLEVADAEHLPFEESQFDVVVSCECLEHVPNPSNMLANIARCLRSGGTFVITTENYFNGMLFAWINAWLRKIPFDSGSGVQPHENFFVFWKVRKMIEDAGLQITRMESNHFVWLLLPGVAPDRFFTKDFDNPVLKRLFRPFGRHFTFQGTKA